MNLLPIAPDSDVTLAYDIEVFPNFFMACFSNGVDRHKFYHTQLKELAHFLRDPGLVLCSYNGFAYDDIMMRYIVANPGLTPADLFSLSCSIIEGTDESERMKHMRQQYGPTPWGYSIDLFQLVNGRGSLKEWQCREGYPNVEDSPADFLKPIVKSDIPGIEKYCWNDVDSTAAILTKKWDLVKLREGLDKHFDLGTSVYRMSEAQLAQHVFVALHERRTGESKSKLRGRAEKNPVNLQSRFPLSQIVLPQVSFRGRETAFWLIDFKKGFVNTGTKDKTEGGMASGLNVFGVDFSKPVQFGQRHYKLGVGGIHSADEPLVIEATEDDWIVDLDVTSYYPNIIINNNLAPAQLGNAFIKDLTMLKDMRIAAKRSGDKVTNEALKIVINSTFGKLDDKYSPLRSQIDALKVTINGQLFILMLIESLEAEGAEILSANTDGVTIRWGRTECETDLPRIVNDWETRTGFELESVRYAKVCRRDVNSYLALTVEGKVKRKGEFALDSGKCDGLASKKAAEAFLLHGTPIEESIDRNPCLNDFLYYQRVKNGGVLAIGDTIIGKTARWYVSDDQSRDPLRRINPIRNGKVTGANIPCGERAALAMDITGWYTLDVTDLDATFYATEARAIVASCYPKPPKTKKATK